MRAFINTARLEDGAEGFDEAGSLAAWLRGRDLLASGAGVTEGEREAAIAVREALRDLAGVNAGRPLPDASSRRLDALAAACGLRPRFDPGGTVSLAPEVAGVAGALGPPAGDRRGIDRGRPLATDEDLPQPRLPVGVLRRHPQPLGRVVRHGGLRQPGQGAQLLRAPHAARWVIP